MGLDGLHQVRRPAVVKKENPLAYSWPTAPGEVAFFAGVDEYLRNATKAPSDGTQEHRSPTARLWWRARLPRCLAGRAE